MLHTIPGLQAQPTTGQGKPQLPPVWAHLQVRVDAAQVVLLQLHAYVLRDEVDGNHVVAPAGVGHTMKKWVGLV